MSLLLRSDHKGSVLNDVLVERKTSDEDYVGRELVSMLFHLIFEECRPEGEKICRLEMKITY